MTLRQALERLADEGFVEARHGSGTFVRSRQALRGHVLVAEFLQKLRDTPDGDGSLLDHSLMMFGNGMSIGTVHSRVDLPYVMAGGGIKGGRYQIEPKETPIGNLLVTVAQKLGVDIEQFGESTGAVSL